MEFFNEFFTEPMILCSLGGFCYPFLIFLEYDAAKKSKTITFTKLRDYISLIIYVFFALLVGYAYFSTNEEVNKILAIHVGVSAPLILRTMANTLPSGISNKKK